MASAAEKTNVTDNKPSAASKELDKLSAPITESRSAISAAAPPPAQPSASGGNGSAQLKTNNQAGSFSSAITQMKASSPAVAQRSESGELEEEELQMKAQPGAVAQRSESSELEEEELQMKAQPGAAQLKVTSESSSTGQSMPAEVRAKMESSMGADFSDVNIHANSPKASNLGAQAYAQGSDIHMAPGKYDPGSTSGQELLGHELAHVVQQREGRVKPTIQAKGVPVNDDAGLEKEADVLGAKAARAETPAIQQKSKASTIGPMPLQRKASGVAQLNGNEPSVQEPEVEGNERDAEEGNDNEQEVPIPPFPSISANEAQEAEQESQEEQAPPLPPRPQYNRPVPTRPAPTTRPTNLQPPPPPPLPTRPTPKVAPPLPPRPAAKPSGPSRSPKLPPPGVYPSRPAPAPPMAAQGPAPVAPPLPRRINPRNADKSLQSGSARVNYNDDGKQDYAEYGILGSGGAAAGASATTKGLQYGDTLVNKGLDAGKLMNGTLPEASTFGETASAVSHLGVIGGVAGTVGAVADGVRAGQYMADKDKTTGDRVIAGGGAMLSAAGSAVKESSTAAFHAATITKNATAAAGAGAAAGIGSIAMGSADVIRGTYGAIKADQRGDKLRGQAEWTENQDVHSAATQAASTQDIRKSHAKGTVVKGLLLIGGGSALLIMGASNPIGWGLLAGAAIVGGIIALRRYLQKKARKKDVAIREMGITAEYEKYMEAKKTHSMFNRQKKVAIPENPLDREMKKHGYEPKDYGKFYADYIHDTAWVLYNCGVMGDQKHSVNQEMRNVIINMGLKVVDKESPKPEAIAKSLHG